jgi:hypothetical protein
MTQSVAFRQACRTMGRSRPSHASRSVSWGTLLPPGIEAEVALADAGYGTDTDFRDGITKLGLAYVVGIQSSTSLWLPGEKPLRPKI